MRPEEQHRAVRDRYAGIARQAAEKQKEKERSAGPGGCGCGCGGGSGGGSGQADTGMKMADYRGSDAGVVEGANLGLGCGIPTLATHIEPGHTVLDLGSGAGVDVFMAADGVGPEGRVIGVDMTPEMVELARANARKDGRTNVEFRLGEIEHLPAADASIDVVISNCVINLVPDKAQVYREIFRILRPGGRFSISDVVSWGGLPREVQEDAASVTGCVGGAMEQEAYLDVIREAGFDEVRVEQQQDYALFESEPYGVRSITVTGTRTEA
ncbi:MAG: arsenite methyltransferase [bacterium]